MNGFIIKWVFLVPVLDVEAVRSNPWQVVRWWNAFHCHAFGVLFPGEQREEHAGPRCHADVHSLVTTASAQNWWRHHRQNCVHADVPALLQLDLKRGHWRMCFLGETCRTDAIIYLQFVRWSKKPSAIAHASCLCVSCWSAEAVAGGVHGPGDARPVRADSDRAPSELGRHRRILPQHLLAHEYSGSAWLHSELQPKDKSLKRAKLHRSERAPRTWLVLWNKCFELLDLFWSHICRILLGFCLQENFVTRLVNETLRRILPALRREELTPEESVLVFVQFSVIQTLVEYSPDVKSFVRNNFYEEFKWVFQNVINKRSICVPFCCNRNTNWTVGSSEAAFSQRKRSRFHGVPLALMLGGSTVLFSERRHPVAWV